MLGSVDNVAKKHWIAFYVAMEVCTIHYNNKIPGKHKHIMHIIKTHPYKHYKQVYYPDSKYNFLHFLHILLLCCVFIGFLFLYSR